MRTAPETIEALRRGDVTELSLDHDLGDAPGVGNGYDVLLWIEEQVVFHGFSPPRLSVHSANPAARPRMEAAVASIGRLVAASGNIP